MYMGLITLSYKNKLCEKRSQHNTYNGDYNGDYVCPHCGFKTLNEFHMTDAEFERIRSTMDCMNKVINTG